VPRPTAGFAEIYDEGVGRVYGFFGYRLSSREEAEDLTQLTFERALRAWDRFDPSRATPATWLMAIARNVLVDHYRRERTVSVADVEHVNGATRAMTAEPGLGISPDLESALGRLSERDRDLIALRFGADLSGTEIAGLTGLSRSNVHQILSRALRRLRDELEPARTPTERATSHAGD